jgi:hypothetical protein
MWLRFFSVLCLFGVWGNRRGGMFYFPIKDLGVAEAYETTWVAILTEVWLKVVITPLLEAIVFCTVGYRMAIERGAAG